MEEAIGPYRILKKLGKGGMGEVYLAEDSRLNRKVALKFLSEHLAEQSDYRKRFLREAKSASSLNHPHIITVYDILSHNHSDVIAMEYVEGESLRTMLLRGSIAIKLALEIAAQIASALAQRIGPNIFRVPGPAFNWQKAEPQKIANFLESGLYIDDPQISMDGSKLLYSRGRITGDIWLMEFH